MASKGDILQYENLLFVTVHVLLRDELHTFCNGFARAARCFCSKIARFWPSKIAFPRAKRAAKPQRARFKISRTLPKRARRTPSDLAHVLQWFCARRAVVLQQNRAILGVEKRISGRRTRGMTATDALQNFADAARTCAAHAKFAKQSCTPG